MDEVERGLGVLTASSASPQWRRQAAAYDVLRALNDSAEVGQQWAPRLPRPTFQPEDRIVGAGQMEDLWFLITLGDRIHSGLQRQGLLWPPPFAQPPPAVTRDIFDLWQAVSRRRIAGASRSDRSTIRPQLADNSLFQACRNIRDKSLRLIDLLDRDVTVNQIAIITLDVAGIPREGTRPPRSRISTLIGGMALAIGLIQGPGAIHNFPNDVRELGGDLITIGRVIATGLTVVAKEIDRSLDPQPETRLTFGDDRLR